MLAVVGGIGLAFVLLIVVCVMAVTLLGKGAKPRFSSIETAIDRGDPDLSIVVPSTARRTTTTKAAPIAATWSTWSAPDGSFSVDLPGPPKLGTKNGTSVQGAPLVVDYARASDVDLGTNYAVSWQRISQPEKRDALESAVLNLTGQFHVNSRSDEPYHGAPAVRVTGYFTADTQFGTALYLIVGDRFYSLIAGGPKPISYDFERFLESFTGA